MELLAKVIRATGHLPSSMLTKIKGAESMVMLQRANHWDSPKKRERERESVGKMSEKCRKSVQKCVQKLSGGAENTIFRTFFLDNLCLFGRCFWFGDPVQCTPTTMVMKFHGNVRGEVRVTFLALFASKPTFSCALPSNCPELFVRSFA